VLCLLAITLSDCKKPEDIGLDTLPSGDLIYTDYSDTATILTSTIREDTLRCDELSRMLFGSIRDNAFGKTNVSFFGQVLLGSTPNLISDSSHTWSADSLVLSLAYTGSSYGDTDLQQNIHVYRMTEDMYTDSTYYSDRVFQTDPLDLAMGNPYTIRPNTHIVLGSDTNAAPQLRIRLSDILRDEIFDKNGQTEFASNDNWKAYFKGINISVDEVQGNGGAILYFDPASANTRMTLYYQEDGAAKNYSFTLSDAARVTHTQHDYTGSSAEVQLNSPSATYGYNFIQPLAGLKTTISFPNLKHFTDSGSILINKAELVISEVTDTLFTNHNQPVPVNILLLAKNASNEFEFPIDYYERSYGGAYSSAARTYTFGITRTIQRILDGTITDYGYTLNILGSMTGGNCALIGSGSTGSSQMKLRLYYTKLH